LTEGMKKGSRPTTARTPQPQPGEHVEVEQASASIDALIERRAGESA
jgi:hypothetical protein